MTAAVVKGALRYREYPINPRYFAPKGFTYRQLLDPIISGLRAAEADLGVGFRLIIGINRGDGAAAELVRTMIDNPYAEVVALGQDDLTPELTEDPGRFADAHALARQSGLRMTAHAGVRPVDGPGNVKVAMDVLKVGRIDHSYMIVDDPELTARAKDSQIPFACTPVSTTICSGWTLDPSHRIARMARMVRMVREGLNVSFSTDDAVFFRTSLAREFQEALPALDLGLGDARAIALAGVEGAFCDEDAKAALRARFLGEIASLDARFAR